MDRRHPAGMTRAHDTGPQGPRLLCEGFAVLTADGLIFTVKGLVHPPERVIAYLRYLPDPEGGRERLGVRYRRVYHFEEQLEVLQNRFPHYLWDDEVFGVRLQSVPRRFVREAFDPCLCLADLRDRGPADLVEEHALGLSELLRDVAGVPGEDLGVSGSVMVGTHTENSDIDLLVYGDASGRAVHRALQRLLDEPGRPVRRLDGQEMAALHAEHRPDTPLSFEDFSRLQNRKVNEGRYRGREYFIRFVKRPSEVSERYGDRRFEALGQATIRAEVTDARDAIFTPCRYTVANATVLDGPPAPDLREVVSFRGRFSDQVRVGEWAIARGSLERVVVEGERVYHHLVVGGQAGDYVRPERVTSPVQ